FAVVTFIFILIHRAPGKPCSENLEPRICDLLTHQFGLDQPLAVQYGRYLVELAHGNLGMSFSLRRPVLDALVETVPFTLQLAGAALALDFLLGLGLGIYQAVRVNRLPDVALGNATLFVYSLPTFWLAPILLLIFGEKLRWFPVGGASDPIFCPAVTSLFCVADRLWHLVLPATTLGVVGAAGTARFQRAAMLEVANQDYVRTARAKGVPERQIVALVTAAEVVRALRHRALRGAQWGRRFFRLRTTCWGLGILMFMVIVALVAPLIAPFDPKRQIDIVRLTAEPRAWTFVLRA